MMTLYGLLNTKKNEYTIFVYEILIVTLYWKYNDLENGFRLKRRHLTS